MFIKNKRKNKITPYLIVICSFLLVVLLGTILLCLPIATKDRQGLSFIDALFTTVSASCVTGLSVVPNVGNTFSIFGYFILAILMEVGGLSLLTFAFFIMVIIGKKVGITSRILMKEALNQNSTNGIMKLVRRIVSISLSIQAVFWIVNIFILYKYYPNLLECIGISAFHTISSFNNAGFDIFGSDNSMINFNSDVMLNLSTMILIFLGGLGFIVLVDVFGRGKHKDLTFHSKVVLSTSMVLLVGGALLFKLTLGNNITWLEAFFTSVTARTAGFTTIDFNVMKDNSSFVIMLALMLIGASPCSTGGGIKTTTIFTICLTLIYLASGKKPKAFKRSFSEESIIKAFALVSFSILYILILVFLLKITDPLIPMNDLVFEAFSAFGTVGVSMGITASLSNLGKLLICLTMFIGRLGPLTVISIWNSRWMMNTSEEVQYIEEKIIIG